MPQPHVCVCQTGIYKLSLTKLSQSNCPISFPAHNHPYSTNPLSPLPIHIYRLLLSPVLMHPLRPVAYVLLSRDCHSVAPVLEIGRYAPGSGRDRYVNTRMLPSIPWNIFFGREASSCLVSAFVSYPTTLFIDNTSGMKWHRCSRQASGYFPFLRRSC